MTILWADGFEDYDYDVADPNGAVRGEYDVFSEANGTAGFSVESGTGRRGGGCLVSGANQNFAEKALPTPITELFASVAINTDGDSATRAFLCFMSGSTQQVSITRTSVGAIEARRGGHTGTLLGTTAVGAAPDGSYTQVQVRVVISDTVGVVQIRLNGSTTPALDLTNVDTNNGAASISCSAVRLGNTATNGGFQGRYDDFVIWDTTGSVANTWLGDTRVDSYFPSANGDSSQFVGSDGNSTDNYLLVSAASPVSSSYVESDTPGDKDLYQFGNLAHTPSNIYGVIVTAAALKDDAGGRSVRLLAKSGTTEADSGADIALSTSRTRVIGVFETNPDTSAAWTKAGVDGAQFGITVAA